MSDKDKTVYRDKLKGHVVRESDRRDTTNRKVKVTVVDEKTD